MYYITVSQVDAHTARLETTVTFDNDLPRENVAVLESVVMSEVEAYTGFAAEVHIDPVYKEADITVLLGWDPVNLGSDIQELVVAAGYARDRIEKEAKE